MRSAERFYLPNHSPWSYDGTFKLSEFCKLEGPTNSSLLAIMRLRRTLLTDPRRSHNGRCVHIHEKNVEHRPKGNRDIDKMLCDHQAIKTIKEMVCILSVHPIDHRFLAIRFAVQWKLADTTGIIPASARIGRIALREDATEEDTLERTGRVYSANFLESNDWWCSQVSLRCYRIANAFYSSKALHTVNCLLDPLNFKGPHFHDLRWAASIRSASIVLVKRQHWTHRRRFTRALGQSIVLKLAPTIRQYNKILCSFMRSLIVTVRRCQVL